jgi:DNA-directed RNA polymerase omega subunit
MARHTAENAINKIGNKFDCILIAAARARELRRGKKSMLPAEDNQAIVLALREIEAGLVGREYLRKIRNGRNTSAGKV